MYVNGSAFPVEWEYTTRELVWRQGDHWEVFFFAKVQTSNAYSDGTCGTGDGGEALTRKLFACVHSEPPPG